MSARSLVRPFQVAGLTLWALVAFIGAQFIAAFLYIGLSEIIPRLGAMNEAVQTTTMAALSYVIAFALVAFVPVPIGKKRRLIELLGIQRLPSWSDIGYSLLTILPYFIVSGLIVSLISQLSPAVGSSGQELPFNNLVLRVEYIVAFITLVILAPLAEEFFFRGYFMSKLLDITNTWFAVIFSSLVFGALHAFGGDGLQWAAAIDTFVLGLALAGLRSLTGSVWAGVLLHMIKNGIAFFILFIYPLLSGTM